ncbi:MAG: glycosyltransferase family 4 protein [bacterium]|nr:glycosyltransferase family 4 protein [bacterium]
MKVFLLSKVNSTHTIRWANALVERGIKVLVFGLEDLKLKDNPYLPEIIVKTASIDEPKHGGLKGKINYLKALPKVKSAIEEFKPDVLHAHYASSYGLIGALTKFHPLIISLWGSDVFDFPKKSFLNALIIRHNLKKADKITSTSITMAREATKYTAKKIDVVPFGVDIETFKPFEVKKVFTEDSVVIGTVKSLEKKYGIDTLISAFALLKRKSKENLNLLIGGDGPERENLKQLVKELKVEDSVVFTGYIPHAQLPKYMNMIDIFVLLSRVEESFGVVVVEAMACGKPVVVSNKGGLPEVVEEGVTGFVVPAENPKATASAIETLIKDKELRKSMGRRGRERVLKLYNWKENVSKMIEIYEELLKQKA